MNFLQRLIIYMFPLKRLHSNGIPDVEDSIVNTRIVEHEVTALAEDYRRISTQITEHSKLQYQLAGVAYAIGGTALSLWGSSSSQPTPLAILFFPPIFCAIVFVQLYLHSTIKTSSRYINFRLRPRMEAILNSGLTGDNEYHTIWDWEEYYVKSHRIVRFFMRQFGSVIVILSLLPAVGAILVYILVINFTQTIQSQFERIWFWVDVGAIVLTLSLIIAVKLINEEWWKTEERELATLGRNT